MGKAKELADDLLAHPLTPEEVAERQRPVGQLQLRADVPAIEVDENVRAQEILTRLDGGDAVVALAGHDLGVAAVAISVGTYLTLIHNSFTVSPPAEQVNLALARKEKLPKLYVEEINLHNPDAPESLPGDIPH